MLDISTPGMIEVSCGKTGVDISGGSTMVEGWIIDDTCGCTVDETCGCIVGIMEGWTVDDTCTVELGNGPGILDSMWPPWKV